MTDDIPRLAVGAQVRRWRLDRGLTLAALAATSGVNTGYLSQIENDKASPSLATLAAIGDALQVPPAWFLMVDTEPPLVVRAADRPVRRGPSGDITAYIDGHATRGMSIIEVTVPPGVAIGAHSHPGDEHHLVLDGRFRGTQAGHVVELGPGDYLRWDGAVPHDGVVIGERPLRMLIFRIRPMEHDVRSGGH